MNDIKETKGIVTFVNTPVTLLGDIVKAGDTASDFKIVNQGLEPVALSDFKGKTVVLSIFPSIDTGVCQKQTRRFNEEAANLSDDIVILTVSKDLPFALGRFCAAEGIDKVKTLSDYQNSEFGLKYGFLMKENMLLARGVVVVDKNGKIVYAEYVPNVTSEPDYEKALAAAKSAL
ncbi:MAG: thiol peroxidase [Tannerella sp.]|jgi:thiol peroxidase|nr:thiol peroxidase [Tannerella sp.]